MCVTDLHDMALAVQVALNPYTTNQTINQSISTDCMVNDPRETSFQGAISRYQCRLTKFSNGISHFIIYLAVKSWNFPV